MNKLFNISFLIIALMPTIAFTARKYNIPNHPQKSIESSYYKGANEKQKPPVELLEIHWPRVAEWEEDCNRLRAMVLEQIEYKKTINP